MKAEVLKGHLDALVLAALEAEPAHGYAIIQRLRLRSEDVFRLPEGTVYPALHRLEADGRITAEWREVQGRRRKIYSVTKTGSDELSFQRARWTEFSASITRVLGGAT